MKNLLTISRDDFKVAITKCTFNTLKDLWVQLAELIPSKTLSDEQVLDLIRKQTAINAEFQARGLVTAKNKPIFDQFNKWVRKVAYKRRLY